jgi:putative aldouronate transport system permease protein
MKRNNELEAGRLPNPVKPTMWGRFVRSLKKYWILYVFLAPTILWYILFQYLPMGGIYVAFTRYKGAGSIFKAKFVGLKWFKSFFNSAYASSTIINTLRISLYGLLTFPLPIILSLLINEVRHEKFKKISQTILYAPHFVSLVVLVNMMTLFFDRSGIVNRIITSLGFESINFMGSPDAFPHLFVWSGVWTGLGWNCIIYLAALSSVDPNLHEAATLDGCSRFKRILYINLPAISPTIIITLILRVGNLMSVSTEKSLLLRNDLNSSTAETIGTFVYNRGLIAGDYSYAAAVGLFINVVNLILLLSVNAISNKVSETSMF